MSWSANALFNQFVTNPLFATISGATKPTGFTSLGADTLKGALFNNSITPNANDVLANSAYAVGQWTTANEVTDATNWVAGGRALSGNAFSSGAGYNQFTANNLAGGGTLTLTNAYGVLVYDSSVTGGTVAKQGICFNYFGGPVTVTSGSFTIVWSANGIFRVNN